MKRCVHLFWITGWITVCCLNTTKPLLAQIVPDASLPNNSNVSTQGNTNIITEGTRAGRNLFHSFVQFSVPIGSTAYFNNALDIQNIISRVTGSSISNIDGLVKANGAANLFLINPNGIIFGPNASLNIGGSFVASTASSLSFADGSQFSATAPQTTPLLTISVPIGLQFESNAGSILNQSTVIGTDTTGVENVVGLKVQSGKTLALVGGDVLLQGGYLTAQQGRIELGSIAGTGQVSLKPTEKGWVLGYEGVQNFKDIQLSQGAYVDASGKGGGDIQVQGRRVELTDGSQLNDTTLGSEPGGNLTVRASDSVELSGTLPDDLFQTSGLATITNGAGKAGDITINTGKLIVQNRATVSTQSAMAATGGGGSLTVLASKAVELTTGGNLLTQASGSGDAGDLTIKTGQLIVQNGGTVSASTTGLSQGNGGNIRVNASSFVDLSGASSSSGIASGLFTITNGVGQGGSITVDTSDFQITDGAVVGANTNAEGNGGNITVNTQTFEAVNGGQVLAITRNSGNAGNITVNATDRIILSDSDSAFAERVTRFGKNVVENEGPASGLFVGTDANSTGNGGNISINSTKLTATDSAGVTVSSQGKGNAGDLLVQVGTLNLDREAFISAQAASGQGGNITLQVQNLLLMRHGSQISASAGIAGAGGNGGNITINSPLLVAVPAENSDISANAFTGNGGQVTINAQGIFGTQFQKLDTPESDITASSSGGGVNGVVNINTLVNNPSQGLVTLPIKPVDVTRRIAQGCPAGVGPRASKFVITGRGGLPPDPTEALRSEPTLADLGTTVQSQENRTSAATSSNPTISNSAPLVEAQGWVTNAKGEVVLVAQVPTVNLHVPWLAPTICQATKTAS